MQVRTRIAPSPTGYPHIGTIYQAMYDFVFARKYQGRFITRIEDTDRSRFVEGAEQFIFESLDWFGLIADEDLRKGGEYGPYRQSERLEIYNKYAKQLIDQDYAYYCYCTKERLDLLRSKQQQKKQAPMYDKHCLSLSKEEVERNLSENIPHVIRLNVPRDQKIVVRDAVVGEVVFDSNQIDDQVLIKSDGFPTYHLAVVVDDYLMKITHVFRGSEWLPSTPKHILLYQFLGWGKDIPKYAHVPLLLDPEGAGKLSKRKGHAAVDFYQKEGYLPEAILNFLANIVWNHPSGQEIFSLKEFERAFELEPFKVEVKPQGARFDIRKLEWMNGEYIRKMSDSELTKRLQEFLIDHPAKDKIAPLVPLVKERIKKLSDFVPLTDFLWEKPEYDTAEFNKVKTENKKEILQQVFEKLEKMEKPWKAEVFEKTFRDLADELKIKAGEMFQLIRIAVSGQSVTPPLFESIQILGEEEACQRVKESLKFLEST
ncbi:glutamate--tRNA ligase [Candidatus Daviesbacteria bacterium RIFCSPLOWO2_02_FULL_36_7]|uniref:Glutamate--tRNA ligase n=1 Tax=Candidatus Daviesbacteria bacterium RIFCSPLOWO2_02_FULL_36_7 TaxID=1797792 RepID=A0A1F5MHS0_9BACT|nr:MAG: glutamate--tRNA ligase [Candidatus Daviesbacteria bacterium RIFCSPLOWO2_02_FULL_36_7]